jgi:hypothetical protein
MDCTNILNTFVCTAHHEERIVGRLPTLSHEHPALCFSLILTTGYDKKSRSRMARGVNSWGGGCERALGMCEAKPINS